MLFIFILFVGGGWLIGKLIASLIPDGSSEAKPTVINNYTTENHLHITENQIKILKAQ